MPDHSLLADLVLTYAIALALVITLGRLRVPSIVAMMIAGIVAGPSGIRVIKTPEEVEMLAEIGIVLLLFTVGLDFSLTAMRQIWRTILSAGADRRHSRRCRRGPGSDVEGVVSALGLHRPFRGALEHGNRAQGARRAK